MGSEISPELVERMAAVIRAYANGTGAAFAKETGKSVFAESCDIANELPVPIDPDLIVARSAAYHFIDATWPEVRDGGYDSHPSVSAALQGIKRGRELQKEGR